MTGEWGCNRGVLMVAPRAAAVVAGAAPVATVSALLIRVANANSSKASGKVCRKTYTDHFSVKKHKRKRE